MIRRTTRVLVLPLLSLPLLAAPAFAAPSIASQVEATARAQLEQQAAASGLAEARFELSVVPPRVAPACSGPVEVDTLDTRQPSRMRFAVRCPGPGSSRQEYIVRARISAPVVVLAAPVAANEVLTDAHVTVGQRDITSIADPVTDPLAAVGQTSRRSLRAGDVLRNNSLSAPVLVKRGDAVVMIARIEGIEVSTAGEALDSGARGATVRVRNSASGQTVHMRVTAPGTVEPLAMPRISR
ncbi:flagellar basal body P-ring formation chaperone FlgA [Massilia sp. GCM10023247]|uniref:flagellar basal body P-ring formation chaperone FlgA n=1 Tax=Massilia sp. GCM10023247 TaxID=3252643 RepID=UPI003606A0D4